MVVVFQMTCLPGHCRTSEELKYTMTRLAMDGVDLFIVEHGCAANIKAITPNIFDSMALNRCMFFALCVDL